MLRIIASLHEISRAAVALLLSAHLASAAVQQQARTLIDRVTEGKRIYVTDEGARREVAAAEPQIRRACVVPLRFRRLRNRSAGGEQLEEPGDRGEPRVVVRTNKRTHVKWRRHSPPRAPGDERPASPRGTRRELGSGRDKRGEAGRAAR